MPKRYTCSVLVELYTTASKKTIHLLYQEGES